MTTTDMQQGSSLPPKNNAKNNSDLEQLSKNLRAVEAGKSDATPPILEKLAAEWQTIIGGIVCVLVIAWVVNNYRLVEEQKATEASANFEEMRLKFGDLLLNSSKEPVQSAPEKPAEAGAEVKSPAELRKDQEKGFNDKLSLLQKSYPGTPYADLAPLYQAQLELSDGRTEEARKILAPLIPSSLRSGKIPGKSERVARETIVSELAALTEVRTYLVGEKPDLAQARTSASTLARSSQMLTIDALLLLSRISQTPEQKTEVAKLAQEITSARPELKEKIERELKRAGIAVAT